MFQSPFQDRVTGRIERLFHVPEAAKSWPGFAHRFDIERIKGANRIHIKIHRSRCSSGFAIEFLIAQQSRAGDDSCAILKQHERSGWRVKSRRRIPKPPTAGDQRAKEEMLLHALDIPFFKPFHLATHWQNAYGWD